MYTGILRLTETNKHCLVKYIKQNNDRREQLPFTLTQPFGVVLRQRGDLHVGDLRETLKQANYSLCSSNGYRSWQSCRAFNGFQISNISRSANGVINTVTLYIIELNTNLARPINRISTSN